MLNRVLANFAPLTQDYIRHHMILVLFYVNLFNTRLYVECSSGSAHMSFVLNLANILYCRGRGEDQLASSLSDTNRHPSLLRSLSLGVEMHFSVH